MSRITAVWMLLFVIGCILINYPFITIFDKRIFIGGIPLVYLYFFSGWLVSIIVVYVFVLMLKQRK